MVGLDNKFFCQCMGKSTHLTVRIFRERELCCAYSIYHLEPDPIKPFMDKILNSSATCGIILTPLGQVYGYLSLDEGSRMILGPSRIMNDDACVFREQMNLLDVPEEEREDYGRILSCLPAFSAERMGWLISAVAMAVDGKKLLPEDIYIHKNEKCPETRIRNDELISGPEDEFYSSDFISRDWEYHMERLILSYVKSGEPERLKELFDAPPSIKGGRMSDNNLQQIKNTCICTATVASRAAIEGGVDHSAAFNLSDIYIRKVEMLQDVSALKNLRGEMVVDFAQQVQRVRYHTKQKTGSNEIFFNACAEYVSRNMYKPINLEKMAKSMGYTRSYLGDRFKNQTGCTLSQYVTQQKILEAQRFLQFTDKPLGDIAELLAFSSQSHFQNTFKKITGETPLEYRHRVHKFEAS